VEGIPLPVNFQEVLSTKHPYIRARFNDQIILSEHWPDKSCNSCHGTGIYCLQTSKPLPKPQPNKPCPCGSEKKFKKCCKSTVRNYTQQSSVIITCRCIGKAQSMKRPDGTRVKELVEEAMNKETSSSEIMKEIG
jgi:hypothetical protein